MGALAIIETLEAAIVRTASGLAPASYRMPLEMQPHGGTHRRFQVRLTGGSIARQYVGAGIAFLELSAAVRVSYTRPGGTAGGGDRQSVNIQAGTDAALIADALTDPRNWDRPTTDIREVRLAIAAARIVDDALREVWETRVAVEAEFPWPA